MKKKLYRFYRHTMRQLARWFLGFWDCPATLKKDRKAEILNALVASAFAIATLAFFCGLVLFFN